MSCWIAIPLPWAFATSYRNLRLVALLFICAISACSTPADRIDQFAYQHEMVRKLQDGQGFQHVIYRRGAVSPGDTLHVYIEGDGRPWVLGGRFPADDPTPRSPLALSLMARDSAPSLYLGRPCYFGLAASPGCDSRYWTDARYGPEVVASMAAALNREIATEPPAALILIGYSGGGALAVLLAPHLERLRQILTVAANLDTENWVTRHGYQALTGSHNPIQAARLVALNHTHLAGARDEVVTPESIERFAQIHDGDFQLVEDYDHICCWEDNWPTLLHNNVPNNAPGRAFQSQE